MPENIGIIGSGMVGKALAKGFIKYGYAVMISSNDPAKRNELSEEIKGVKTGNFNEAAKFGDILVLSVHGTAAEEVVKSLDKDNLKGKTIIDTTNPIADSAPVNGVLPYFTSINESLMERLIKFAPDANFVKSFSCVGAAYMVDPDFGGQKPTMFICGNESDSKNTVKTILKKFGWEYEDMGEAESARAIEPLAILWCLPGLRENRWTHALKLLKL
jgi:8-hydroxy-5-deazaflavin:NADPH oxidoreductase